MIQMRLASALKAAAFAIFATSAVSGYETIHWTGAMNDDLWGDNYLFPLGAGAQDFSDARTEGFVIRGTAAAHLDLNSRYLYLHSSGDDDDPLLFDKSPAPVLFGQIYREDGQSFSLVDIDGSIGAYGTFYLRNDSGYWHEIVDREDINIKKYFLSTTKVDIYLRYEKLGELDGRDWYGNETYYSFRMKSFKVGALPEPSSWLFMLMGFAGIATAHRRRGRVSGAALEA